MSLNMHIYSFLIIKLCLFLFSYLPVNYLPVRLQDGPNEMEGRVEVFYNGIWGSLCNIDQFEAQVICRQLGFRFYHYFCI